MDDNDDTQAAWTAYLPKISIPNLKLIATTPDDWATFERKCKGESMTVQNQRAERIRARLTEFGLMSAVDDVLARYALGAGELWSDSKEQPIPRARGDFFRALRSTFKWSTTRIARIFEIDVSLVQTATSDKTRATRKARYTRTYVKKAKAAE